MKETARERKRHRISTPDELHDYIRVTGPKLWILLALIILLLTGTIIRASTYRMENAITVQAEVMDAEDSQGSTDLLCDLRDERGAQVRTGMKAEVAGEEGTVTAVIQNSDSALVIISLDREGTILRKGIYDARIILESVTPISFLLNK